MNVSFAANGTRRRLHVPNATYGRRHEEKTASARMRRDEAPSRAALGTYVYGGGRCSGWDAPTRLRALYRERQVSDRVP